MTDPDKLKRFAEIIEQSGKTVFFGGAGVSTESGIPDFRGSDGVFKGKYRYPAEVILSADFLDNNPEFFFEFYREKLVYPLAMPNPAHIYLAGMEACGKLRGVVTQNIDGLHQSAGSVNVLELHGSIYRNYCRDCGKNYDLAFIMDCGGVPACNVCGGLVRPDVTLYGEELDSGIVRLAVSLIAEADTLIVGGTSLSVYPAAGLLGYFRGRNVVIINKTSTMLDNQANLMIHGSIGEIFNALMEGGKRNGG